jgi:hypothetical protein
VKIVLERHRYAPELNKAYVGPSGVCVKAPGCTSIKEVRFLLFAPIATPGLRLTMQVVYPGAHASYGRTVTGRVYDLNDAAMNIAAFRTRHNLPGGEFFFRLRLVG